MAFKSVKGNQRNSLLSYFVSGKATQYHSAEFGYRQVNLGLTATGGVVSEYVDGSTVYRAHIFTSSGTFAVSALGSYGSNVEYLVVAGGGGGGSAGGGGGAGGFRTNVPGTVHSTTVAFPVSTSPGAYTVTIGAGGNGTAAAYPSTGATGSDSSFSSITSNGGGGGASGASGGSAPGVAGGSGGGAGRDAGSSPGGASTSVTTPSPWSGPSTQGNIGGTSYPGGGGGQTAGGGGGAGGAGIAGGRYDISNPATYSQGGAGIPMNITGITTHYAGGGGGGQYPGPTIPSTDVRIGGSGVGGSGGNSTGSPPTIPATNGTFSTGSGGGGSGGPSSGGLVAANGGSGIVVVRYQIGQLTATAKATGGAISYYGGKTIHTFMGSGTFQVTNGPISGETLIVAGGGGAGYYGGGGGAGGLLWYGSPTPTKTANGSAITYLNSTTYPISVGAGGGAVGPYSVDPKQGNSGTASVITHPSGPYSATGGGGGGGNSPASNPFHTGLPGGSGGGASNQNASGSPGPGISGQGNAGGTASGSANSNTGGGGGGAGGSGSNGPPGHGGIGLQFSDFGAIGAGYPGPGGGTGWFAGGGGGGGSGYGESTPNVTRGGGSGGPYAGGGDGNAPTAETHNGRSNSGGGGGSSSSYPGSGWDNRTGAGGSGIVIIAYPS